MNGGGVEAVVMNYYRHIDRTKVQFDFVVTESSTYVPRKEMESLGARVFTVPAYTHLRAFQRASYELFEAHPEWRIVHSHMNALSVFPLKEAAKAGVPVRIAHSHSTSGKGETVKNVVKFILRRQSNKYPTHRFACSNFAGKWLFGKDAAFDLMYNAIDLNKFFFNAKARAEARADLGIVDNQFVIGHIGRYVAQKNHKFLLQAFEELVQKRPECVLLLAGDGDQRHLMESWVVEHKLADKVKFLGQRNDIAQLYQAFDAFVLPSLYEGLGLVGIEAQASGLPCVLSDRITREVDVTGTCEFLSVDDCSAWADAMRAVEARSNVERAGIDCANFAKYDIVRQGQWLSEYYLRLFEGAGHR